MQNREIIESFSSKRGYEWLKELDKVKLFDIELLMSEARLDSIDSLREKLNI